MSFALGLVTALSGIGNAAASPRGHFDDPVAVTACAGRVWVANGNNSLTEVNEAHDAYHDEDHKAFAAELADIYIRLLDDCERLVRAFYGRALSDPVIGFIFVDVAHLDLEEHVPRIASFWETILLGAQSYAGGAFRPHAVRR